jgi:hypothetical protein
MNSWGGRERSLEEKKNIEEQVREGVEIEDSWRYQGKIVDIYD